MHCIGFYAHAEGPVGNRKLFFIEFLLSFCINWCFLLLNKHLNCFIYRIKVIRKADIFYLFLFTNSLSHKET